MDLIIIILLITLVAILYKDVRFVVYLITTIEVLLRVLHFVGDNIRFINLNSFIDKIFPKSLFTMFSKYTTGIIYDIISWTLIIGFVLFIYYMIMYFIKKK